MQLYLKERLDTAVMSVARRGKLFWGILLCTVTLTSLAQSVGYQNVKGDVKKFYRGYELMIKYANDTNKINKILDTLNVPDYVKEVLEFMADYGRSIWSGQYEYCISEAKQLLEKIEREYKGNVPEHHYKWMIGAVNQGYGSCLYYIGDYINSYFSYKQAYEMFNSVGDSTFTAIALTNMATVLIRVKMYDEVLKYYVLARKYLIKDTMRLIPLNTNIGVVYMYLNRPDLTLRYYNEALVLANRLLEKDSSELSGSEKRRLIYRKYMIKTNIASLFLEAIENKSKPSNMELIQKMKVSISKLLDSARVLNRQVDTSMVNVLLKGAYINNELMYWQLRNSIEDSKESEDSLRIYLQLAKSFYKKYGEYDKEGKKATFLTILEHRDLIPYDEEKLYNECLELIEYEHKELQTLASSLGKIDLPVATDNYSDRLLGELPYQCSMKYAVSGGLAILLGTLLVLVSFLFSRRRRVIKR